MQGGGAKLFALVAALEAIEDELAKKSGWLQITRIAGTSAGAIVGGLFAAGVSAREMKAKFASIDLASLLTLPEETAFLGSKRRMVALAGRFVTNRPLASDSVLRKAMLELLEARGLADPDLNAIQTPLRVIAANISDRTPRTYDSATAQSGQKLVRALQHSSAIPFFFVSARPDQTELVVDGGLVENLPVQSLARDGEAFGQMLALSFLNQPSKTPSNSLELAFSLLDTAMNSSVRRSRNVSGLSLVDLDPCGVGTFDFERAQKILSGEDKAPYLLAKKNTLDGLQEIKKARGAVVSNVRWDSIEPATSGQLLDVYKSQQETRLFRQHLRRLTVFCKSLLEEGEEDFGNPDNIVQEMEFSPAEAPIDCLMARIFVDEGQMPRTVDTLITDINGKTVPFKAIPVASTTDEGLRVYALQLSFLPPLERVTGKERYRLRQEFRIASAFPLLSQGKRETMKSKITRADQHVDLVELVVHLPKSFGKITRSALEAGPECSERPWTPEDSYKIGFQSIIWQAQNVANETVVGFEFRREATEPSD